MLATNLSMFNNGSAVLIFDHIYKCGGTTMYHCLKNAFGSITVIESARSWLALRNQVINNMPAGDRQIAVAGHRVWGLHTVLPEEIPCYYFTILREPSALAQSEFFYAHARGFCTADPNALNFWLLEHNFDSMVTHLTGGDADAAINKLDSRYALVGQMDRYNDTLTELSRMTGRQFKLKRIKNASPLRIKADEKILGVVRERGGPDFRLYEHFHKTEPQFQKNDPFPFPKDTWTSKSAQRGVKPDDNLDTPFKKNAERVSLNMISLKGKSLGNDIKEEILLKAIAENGDRACEFINPSHITPIVADAVKSVIDSLEPFISQSTPTVLNSQLAKARILLARSTAWAQNLEQVEQAFKKNLDLPGANTTSRIAYAVWLRQQGRAQEALKILDPFTESMMQSTRFLREWLVTLYSAFDFSAVQKFLSNNPGLVERILPQNIISNLSGFPIVSFPAFRDKQGLIIRCGPDLVMQDVLNELSSNGGKIDIVLQEDSNVNVDGFRNVVRIESGRLNPDRVVQQAAFLSGIKYDFFLAVFPTLSTMLLSKNVSAFFRKLDCRAAYVYLLDNIFLPTKKKYLFEITEEVR